LRNFASRPSKADQDDVGSAQTSGTEIFDMESRHVLFASLALCLVAAMGCGSGDAASPSAAGNNNNAAPLGETDLKPEQVVRKFLEAVRTGDDAEASKMLTEVARQETQKHDLVVAPKGSETAKFEVGDVEYVLKDELAHVQSKWTDIGDDGQPHGDDIIWALRRDDAGWRIAGMATTIFPGEPPLLLDFEKPEEMMQQQKMAEEEMNRRERAAASPTAQVPPAAPATTKAQAAPMAPATKAQKRADGNVLRQ
jgi:hypothetical protein